MPVVSWCLNSNGQEIFLTCDSVVCKGVMMNCPGEDLVAAMEAVSGQQVPKDMNRQISKGANELDLVRSGLDDTMRMAFQDIHEVMKTYPDIKDYRTAM